MPAQCFFQITTLDMTARSRFGAKGFRTRHAFLRAIRTLTDAGVPVGVSIAPIIPGLNESEIPAILQAARDAGAQFATFSMVRLPGSGSEVPADWLDRHVSQVKKDSVLSRIRETHGGSLSDSRPMVRMTGEGERAAQLGQLFRVVAEKLGFTSMRPNVTTENFRRVELAPMELGLYCSLYKPKPSSYPTGDTANLLAFSGWCLRMGSVFDAGLS